MDVLREQLNAVCNYTMSEATIDSFLELMTEVQLKNKEPLIPYGKFDNNVYIVKEGIIRFAYFDGLKEKTFAFGVAGDVVISYHSYYKNIPSFFQYESCGDSVVMKIHKAKIDKLLLQSNDFALWMLNLSSESLWCWERKTAVINGTAKERFEALLKNRPEILLRVSNKVIASYIGIIPSSLSRLKRQLMPKIKK